MWTLRCAACKTAFDWESLAGRVPSHRLSPTYWAASELHLQVAIDERRGEVVRIKTELSDLKRFVDTLLPEPTG